MTLLLRVSVQFLPAPRWPVRSTIYDFRHQEPSRNPPEGNRGKPGPDEKESRNKDETAARRNRNRSYFFLPSRLNDRGRISRREQLLRTPRGMQSVRAEVVTVFGAYARRRGLHEEEENIGHLGGKGRGTRTGKENGGTGGGGDGDWGQGKGKGKGKGNSRGTDLIVGCFVGWNSLQTKHQPTLCWEVDLAAGIAPVESWAVVINDNRCKYGTAPGSSTRPAFVPPPQKESDSALRPSLGSVLRLRTGRCADGKRRMRLGLKLGRADGLAGSFQQLDERERSIRQRGW